MIPKKKMYIEIRIPTNHMKVSPAHERARVNNSVRTVISTPHALKKPAKGT